MKPSNDVALATAAGSPSTRMRTSATRGSSSVSRRSAASSPARPGSAPNDSASTRAMSSTSPRPRVRGRGDRVHGDARRQLSPSRDRAAAAGSASTITWPPPTSANPLATRRATRSAGRVVPGEGQMCGWRRVERRTRDGLGRGAARTPAGSSGQRTDSPCGSRTAPGRAGRRARGCRPGPGRRPAGSRGRSSRGARAAVVASSTWRSGSRSTIVGAPRRPGWRNRPRRRRAYRRHEAVGAPCRMPNRTWRPT